jgi:hypothetical protein
MDGTMSVTSGRAAVVRTIEELGVVAVIRMRDATKLRHVIDALTDVSSLAATVKKFAQDLSAASPAA